MTEMVYTVCCTKAFMEAHPDHDILVGGEGSCAQCGTGVVWRSETIEGKPICQDCMAGLMAKHPGQTTLAPSAGAVEAMGKDAADALTMLAAAVLCGPVPVIERATQAADAAEATTILTAGPLAAADAPEIGSERHDSFLAGKNALLACVMTGLMVEQARGRLQHVDAETMAAIGAVMVDIDVALSRAYGVDELDNPLTKDS